MKQAVKKLLKRWNLLEKIQYHPLYRLRKDKEFRSYLLGQIDFYSKILGKENKLIFDIGANVGDSTYIFRKLASKVIAIDPDSHNNKILKARYSKSNNIVIVPKAVSSLVGEADFFIQSDGCGLNTLSRKWVNVLGDAGKSRFEAPVEFSRKVTVQTITLDLLIKEYGAPDFIKIDVEGYELEVLKGLSKPVPLVSIESNLPEFLVETISIIDMMEKLSSNYEFNFVTESVFILPAWVNAGELRSFLNATELRYMEIFCRLSN